MRRMQTMDGNYAAAYISYGFTELAAIYPITPSSPMPELVDEWAAKGKKNMFGHPVKVIEMEHEGGAAGAVHGALQTGTLTTTYTASQGLLLMIPNLYKLAGQLLPGVIHVASRALSTHALSIFGDFQDVMACRAAGCAMMVEGSVQEVMDLSAVAHLSALKGRVPFINFFEGFRTSHEIQKVEVLGYDELKDLVDQEALAQFRAGAMHVDNPSVRGALENDDVYFVHREAQNGYYNALPHIVEEYMQEINARTGRDYHLFTYTGAPDATDVIVAMGSATQTINEVVRELVKRGEKVGAITVHLFRPFSVEHLLRVLPTSVQRIAVIDRTKEPGSMGEPLFLDVQAAIAQSGRQIRVIAGRYGLAGHDVIPEDIVAIVRNLQSKEPQHPFTVGIVDDVTHLSLPRGEAFAAAGQKIRSCKFWGFGSDGTVGANKSAIKVVGDLTDSYVQAFFAYDSKKSGGVTISHLRFSDKPIEKPYLIRHADFIAVHRQSYVNTYDVIGDIKDGGTFLLNCMWSPEELEDKLPAKVKRILAQRHIHFYIINAAGIAEEIGLGNRINMVCEGAFFKLTDVMPLDDAVAALHKSIEVTYGNKGDAVVAMNRAALERGVSEVQAVPVPPSWADAVDEVKVEDTGVPFVDSILRPINSQKGYDLPVSAFKDLTFGVIPPGTAAYEKRGVSLTVPHWIKDNCIQCNQCAFVCPHATIRPVLASADEVAKAPDGFETVPALGANELEFRISVNTMDCLGCGNCADICPAPKGKALVMKPFDEEVAKQPLWDYGLSVADKDNPMNKFTVKGSQFETPLLEFSGACAGCGETPYVKLITQLFGDRMIVANASGCSSVWGSSMPSNPYTVNAKGQGPAWASSLFEDNAEFGFGMFSGTDKQRKQLATVVETVVPSLDGEVKEALTAWKDGMYDGTDTRVRADRALAAVTAALESTSISDAVRQALTHIKKEKRLLVKPSQWIVGGDGWAYDIGYGGIDHVLAAGEDVNVLVLDTEVYSNTGGQASKATHTAAVAQFASAGKRTKKKDLGMMAMSYGYVYVAQVAMGADKNQLLKAIREAEAYPGPSLIIAYAPCINHGIKAGMGKSQEEARRAVACGYWDLYRYNPALRGTGVNPFSLDSKEPTESFRDFLMGEVRYSSLARSFPEVAEELFQKTEADARERRQSYVRMQQALAPQE